MMGSRIVRGSMVVGALALMGCAEDDAAIAEPAPVPTASWTTSFEAPASYIDVDDLGGVWLLEGERVRHVTKAGTEDWSLMLDLVNVSDVELEGGRATIVGTINPGSTGSIGGRVVDVGAANPNLPVAVAFDVSLAGEVGRIDVWQADEGLFFPSQITSLGDGRRAVAGTLSGSMTIGESVTAQGGLAFITDDEGTPLVPISLGESGSVSFEDLVTDPTTGELFMIGTFRGVLDVGGELLADGPSNGGATFFGRFTSTGEAAWFEHRLGEGAYDARALADGHVLVQGAIDESSFPLELAEQALVGPLAFRLDAAGNLVDAVALGREVRVNENYGLQPGESYTMGSVAMTAAGAVVQVVIERSLREDDQSYYVHDDVVTVRHRSPSGVETQLFTQDFPDGQLLPYIPTRAGADGSLALAISTLPTDPDISNFSLKSSVAHFAAP